MNREMLRLGCLVLLAAHVWAGDAATGGGSVRRERVQAPVGPTFSAEGGRIRASGVIRGEVSDSLRPASLSSEVAGTALTSLAEMSVARQEFHTVPVVVETGGRLGAGRTVPANDNCEDAFEVNLSAGDLITVQGDNTGATLDCPVLAGATPWREVWFKITTTNTLTVSIDYCGTMPAFMLAHGLLMETCPCDLPFISTSEMDMMACGDGNTTLIWENLPAGTYYWPLLTDSMFADCEGPYTINFKAAYGEGETACPEGSLFGQPPAGVSDDFGAWPSGSSMGMEASVFERITLSGPIHTIHWWGLVVYYNPWFGLWDQCGEPGASELFEISFYENGPDDMPGALVATYLVEPTVVDLGPFWIGGNLYHYSVEGLTPCAEMENGWISVRALPQEGGCTFGWLNSMTGDDRAYWYSHGTGEWMAAEDSMSLCLAGGDCPELVGACCIDEVPTCHDQMTEFECYQLGGRFVDNTLCNDIVPPCGESIGACCHPDATCTLTTPSNCADNWLGPDTTCDMCPCVVPCPAEAILEPEACGEDTNGGCNMDIPAFAPLACGDTICGTAWANYVLRDTDWYQVVTDDWRQFTWTAEGEVPLMILAYKAGANGCDDFVLFDGAEGDECQPVTFTTGAWAPGEYWFTVTPADWRDWPCDQQYVATLTCSPAAPDYCPGSGACDEGGCEPPEFIDRVQIGAIDNVSMCEKYGDFTHLSTDAPIAGSVPMLVTNAFPYGDDRCSVWVDWDHNFLFDEDELVGTVEGLGPYPFEVVPPVTAVTGPTRMRVRLDYATPGPQPCGDMVYGEVEDYTINVVELPGACCLPDGSCVSALPSECAGEYAGPLTVCAMDDCNSNGIDDACEIAGGVAFDCNGNGIPDECDIANCPLGDASCADCQGNGIPDGCEVDDDGSAYDYQLDDGSADNRIGLSGGGSFGWLSQFVVTPGNETITEVAIAYGLVPNGGTVTLYVWSDPDQDGDPSDARVLTSATSVIADANSDTFVYVTIPPTKIGGSGEHFFVGVIMQQPYGDRPAALDQSVASGRSWIVGDTLSPLDPNNLAAADVPPVVIDDLGLPGNWLIRADAGGDPDCNDNLVPDECDPDCDGDGIPDDCDLCGDLDNDEDVDYDDYVIFLDAFGGAVDGDPTQDACCDYDGSGAVGMADFDAWLGCYRAYVNDPLAGPPTVGKRRIRVPLSPLPKQGLGPVPSP